MQLKDLFYGETERKRFRHATFSPAVSVMGEAAESIWRRVNIAIVESSLRFILQLSTGVLCFLLKKALLPWNFKCRGDKMLVAYWRPVLKFWSPTINLWLHWRPVSRNFGPCHLKFTLSSHFIQYIFILVILYIDHSKKENSTTDLTVFVAFCFAFNSISCAFFICF